MALIVVGVNHRGASLDVRERLAYRAERGRAPRSTRCRERCGAREAVLLSTCNRTEIYSSRASATSAPDVWAALSERLGARRVASTATCVATGTRSTHLFRVASGLDSMVLGEAQIHGQVRDAWEVCRAHSGPVLNRLFQTSLLGRGTRAERDVDRARRRVGELGGRAAGEADLRIARRASARWCSAPARWPSWRSSVWPTRACARRSSPIERSSARRSSPTRYGAVAMHYDECWARSPTSTCSSARRRRRAPSCSSSTCARRSARAATGRCAFSTSRCRATSIRRSASSRTCSSTTSTIFRRWSRRTSSGGARELPTAEQLIDGEVGRYWDWVAGLAAVPVLTRDARAHGGDARARACGGVAAAASTCRRPNEPSSKNFPGAS